MEFALLDLLNEEKSLVKQINELEHDIQFKKKRAEELQARNTLCDGLAALECLKDVKKMLENQLAAYVELREVKIHIREYLKEVLIK